MRAVDLFAGAGGSSTGLGAAGLEVVYAANHWQDAVDVHARNHPGARHECQDLQQADFHDLPAYDLLWASPACQGHSNAASGGQHHNRNGRGSAPQHDALRATAWAAVTAAEVGRPAFAVIENVSEFASWTLFPAWLAAWEALGYRCAPHVINSADCGVPQDRKRLYLVFARGRKLHLGTPRSAWRPMSDFVDLGAGKWTRLAKAHPGVQKRVSRAIERHGYAGAFHTQSTRDNYGRSLDRPAPTVTTKHQHGWVRGSGPWRQREYRAWNVQDYRAAMGFPESYDLNGAGVCKGCKMLGNAVTPPVAKWIAEQLKEVL